MKNEKLENSSINSNIKEQLYQVDKGWLLSTIESRADDGTIPTEGRGRLELGVGDQVRDGHLGVSSDDVRKRCGLRLQTPPIVIGSYFDSNEMREI
ncbi:hypothetical protein [Bacillus norwichensis]|uniref:Uncharacterized protein n=1 Tax=Bacillus norwichensis TaxID=2762217 RepID=A0ABR8VM10_9BACI|nr:hypothetical protein [Bacillus norwichensis]MBD8005780.1 hypothetical protein [Bacillus norwichensis]RKJ09082.1 hypothetical protein D7X33_49845 [Butyricicoccus sp. 1XD8-22]